MKFEKCLKTTSKKALHRFAALAAVLLAVCLAFMTPAAAEAWDGTSVDTRWYNDESTEFTISTPAQLAGLAKLVNEGNGFNGKIIKLNADIDLGSKEWTPIGCDWDNTFKGTFDGNSKTISGMNITKTSNTLIAVGLFGYSEGTVNNLSINGIIDISLTKNKNEDYLAAGSIVGTNSGATISNCYADVNIEADSETSVYVGCIAGESLGNSNILNCYVSGDVTGTAPTVYAGGIVGGIAGGAEISNCYATGNVTVIATVDAYVGGISGFNPLYDGGTVSNCYALNKIVTASDKTTYVYRISTSGLTNNFGWAGMQVNNKVVTNGETNDGNGTSVYAVNFWKNLDFFAGFDTTIWEINEDYPLPVLKGQTIPSVETITYLEPKFTLTYNKNGGEGTEPTATYSKYASGEPEIVKSDNGLTKVGYTFKDWNTAENGDGDALKNGYIVITEATTLYAQWTPITYTIKFDANGGTGNMDELSVNYDEDKVLTTNSFTKTGYTFAGWKSEDGTVTYSDGQTVKNLTSEPDREVTLYAQWTANTYTVKFHNNTGTGLMNDQTFTYDEEQPLAALNFTNGDKHFGGWATAADGEPVYADKATVKNLTAGANGVFNLYANWTDSPLPTYNVTFDSNGGSDVESQIVLSGQCATEPTTPTKTGYTFVGWENNSVAWNFADAVTLDITLVANWTANTYTVAFDANGGSGSMNTMSFTYGESQALTANAFAAPAGMVFNGWNTKADGSGTAYADKATVSDLTSENGVTVTLYAQWKSVSSGSGSHSTTKTTYTVTFNANGGEGEMFPQTFASGKEKALNLNFFTREGYTFEGWATSADGDVVYTDGETIKVSKSMTLYAVWESNEPVNPQQPGDNPEQPGDEPENPEKPTEPETPAPILAVLAGLGAAVVLRRK